MTAIITNPKERTRFIRFAVVGAIGAVIDFGVFNFLTSIVRILPVIASMISFAAAVNSNFTWNRFWTYPDSRSKPVYKQLTLFAFINTVGLTIRTPIFAFLEIKLPAWFIKLGFSDHSIFTPEFLAHNFALATAVIVVMFWNFSANRYLTYNDIQ